MYDDNFNAPPVNPLPPVIVAVGLALFAVEALLSLGGQGIVGGADSVGWRSWAIQNFALKGNMQGWMLQSGQFPTDFLLRYLTYPIVHGGFIHMAFATVIFLALGKVVAEIFAAWAVLVVFFASSILGAVVFSLTGTTGWLFGSYPGVFGILGAFTFLLWVDLAAKGANQYRAFTLIGFLLGIRLLFGLLFGADLDWIAEVVGFATGFGLSFVVCPGGWGHVVARLRLR